MSSCEAGTERHLRTLALAAPIGIFVLGPDGELLWANPRHEELMGRPLRALRGEGWLDAVHPDEREALARRWRPPSPGRGDDFAAFRVLTPGGEERALEARLTAVADEGFEGWIGTVQDVTAEQRARGSLAAREEQFRLLAEHSGDVLSRHDADGTFRYASPASEALCGRPPEALVGTLPCDIVHEDDLPALQAFLNRVVHSEETQRTPSFRVRCADGRLTWFESAVRAVRDPATGRPSELVAVTRDVSERQEAERQLTRLAMHDHLTGLPNRTLFLDRLGFALRRTSRLPEPLAVAVLFIDVDGFKVVNDSLGHAAGDRVLVEVAERLQDALRPGDTVARLGGDEFIVLCEQIRDEQQALAIARRLVERFAAPFTLAGDEVFLDASVGIALSRSAHDAPEGLVRDADAAMYRAKELGRGRMEVFRRGHA